MTFRDRFLSFSSLAQVAFWLILFVFIFSLSTAMLSWPNAIYRTVLIILCHLVNFYVCYSWLVPSYYDDKKRIGSLLVGVLALLVVLTPIRIAVEQLFLAEIVYPLPGHTTSRLGLILFTEVAIAAFGSLLRLASSREHARVRIAELEKMNLQAELRFLKGQMGPHFLFNTINNIYSLTLVKSNHAPEAVMKLSGLLRYMLYESHGNVTLQREWEALQSLRDLFQLKFQRPLAIRLLCEVESCDKIFLEPHLLLPLLENTFKHSGLGIDEKAHVLVEIKLEDGQLKVTMVNTKGSKLPAPDPGGIGLENIRKRLQHAYPGRHKFEVSESDFLFSVKLSLFVS